MRMWMQEVVLQDVQQALLPGYAVRVPLQRSDGVTAACRAALLSWALLRPLRDRLVVQRLEEHYGWVGSAGGRGPLGARSSHTWIVEWAAGLCAVHRVQFLGRHGT